MRTLSATLAAAQKGENVGAPLAKVVLTQGETTYTYYASDRILDVKHNEGAWSQKATIVLNNADGALSAIDFTGHKAVISYGVTTSAGDEYSACAPLWVIPQEFESSLSQINVSLECWGALDLMSREAASGFWIPALTDTVKDVVAGILDATNPVFSHCTAYTDDWDSEDSLVDTYLPKQTIPITEGMSRLTAIRLYLANTKCILLADADGHVTIKVPKTLNDDGYTSSDDSGVTAYGVNWKYQTFTATNSCTKWGVYLMLYRAASPGTVTVSLRATDGDGKPTGADLASGTTSGNTLPTTSPYEWRYIPFAASYDVTATTKYAIVVRAASGDSSNYIVWRRNSAGAYTGGNGGLSGDSGSTWSPMSATDFMFHFYDYEYKRETAGHHTFFAKKYRNKIVIPNYVTINSRVGDLPAYAGTASDSSYTKLRFDAFGRMRLASDAQAAAIAAAIIANAQAGAEGGSGIVPMNVGQEMYDYVKITDDAQGDTRFGNIGFLHRRYAAQSGKWEMSFGFGGWLGKEGMSRSLITGVLGDSKLGEGSVTNIALASVADVGDTLIHSNDTADVTSQTTYTKVREILIPCYGYLRIKFDLLETSGTVYGRIYRNGSAVGTERTETGGWTTYSQDISNWNPGDLCQLYVHISAPTDDPGNYRNFRIYIDDTNQIMPNDPHFVNTL